MGAADECIDLETTSRYLGFAPQHLYFLVENSGDLYTSFELEKKSSTGGTRTIEIPYSELKGVQRVILRKVLSGFPVSDFAHSYIPKRSILTACRKLCGGKSVLKLDIRDFFPSITFRRVFGLLIAEGFNEKGAYILTRLMMKENHLAQGAPTSPALSNLIVRGMDKELGKLSVSWELGFVRYSDDMFFYKAGNFNHPRFAELASLIVERSGFVVNEDKTKYYAKGKPRLTLGLLTHGDAPQIPGPQRRVYRSAFFRASRDPNWGFRNKERLKGMLEWYKSVYGRDGTYEHYRAAYENIGRLYVHAPYRSE